MKNKVIKNSGFTLVELAIVLVIIGLLVGGVLQGQELIKQAQIRSIITSIGQFDTAVNTFRAKYNNALPGDFNKASGFGLNSLPGGTVNCTATYTDPTGTAVPTPTTTTGCNGDNNGILTDVLAPPSTAGFSGEIANFWVQLSNAGLIKQTITQTATAGVAVETNYPKMPLGTGIVALSEGKKLYYVVGIGPAITTNMQTAGSLITTTQGLKPEEAYSIDNKLDNGTSNTGIVQATEGYSNIGVFDVTITGGSTATDCVGTTPFPYNVSGTAASPAKNCTIRIRASS